MITADNITDEQIHQLRNVLGRERAQNGRDLNATNDALYTTAKHPNDPDYDDRRERGRVRCAEILEARRKEGK